MFSISIWTDRSDYYWVHVPTPWVVCLTLFVLLLWWTTVRCPPREVAFLLAWHFLHVRGEEEGSVLHFSSFPLKSKRTNIFLPSSLNQIINLIKKKKKRKYNIIQFHLSRIILRIIPGRGNPARCLCLHPVMHWNCPYLPVSVWWMRTTPHWSLSP